MPHARLQIASRFVLVAVAFTILAIAITSRTPKWFMDFDQPFYVTIAYDIDRHGVFSNGIFDKTDSTRAQPTSGMFFVPGYPLLVLAAMKIDSRFATAVKCSVESDHGSRNWKECEVYATPIHLIHALLLAVGVLGFALSGELIFGSARVFWLAGLLAIGALTAESNLFSFIMTESMTIALYSLTTLFAVLAWQTSRIRYFVLEGFFIGLLCLTRPSFVVLIPVLLLLIAFNGLGKKTPWSVTGQSLAFLAACLVVVGPWIVRNHFAVGKWGLTEEYGSAALVERFAYNEMTVAEFIRAFPYCTPGIGDLAFDRVDGKDSMHRFLYNTRGSFFDIGRGRRDALVQQHIRLDAVIGGIVADEMRTNWWRHLLVSIPLGWCGMWVGWLWSLILLPLFGWAVVRSLQRSQPLLLLYAAPAIVMLGLHAAVANHYTRYNLILIGPFCIAAAWLMTSAVADLRSRRRVPSPAR